jgi:hypothetical protein
VIVITRTGLAPSVDCGPSQGNLRYTTVAERLSSTPHFPLAKAKGFSAGLFLVHSPLLKESLLVSFPPPSYMLKFSG